MRPGAEKLFQERVILAEDRRVEGVIWRVPKPVPPSRHPYKYRLVYIVGGLRVVGYDNERGKGDHRHFGNAETAYVFTTVSALLADFQIDIARWNDGYGDF